MPKVTWASSARFLWALVLVTLPVTSFRVMPFMGSGTSVRPLALYPLVLLLPVLFIRLKRGEIPRPMPGAVTILLAFMIVVLALTAFGASFPPNELRGIDYADRAIRAVVTLGIGLAFFMAAVWMNQDLSDLKFSVRWLLLGLAVDLAWAAVQFVGLNSGHRQVLRQIQNLFSVRGLVKNKRVSGFAFEPSWLAGQISSLYLPWLLAAVLMRVRAWDSGTKNPTDFGWSSWKRVSGFIEPVLLVGAVIGLLMTYSRSGLVIAALSGLVTFLLVGKEAWKIFWSWFRRGFDRHRWNNFLSTLQNLGLRMLLIGILLAFVIGTGVFLTDKGYISAVIKADKSDIFAFAQDVYLGPRLAYSSAAMSAFSAHPLTGAGLGASGFWIYPNMPDWVLSGNPEIAQQLNPNSNLYPNPKNLFVRLLAETGLVGFILFLSFYFNLFGEGLKLLKKEPVTDGRFARWLAAVGFFALTSIFLQGISQDSFAMPEIWINLGILAGSAGYFLTNTKAGNVP